MPPRYLRLGSQTSSGLACRSLLIFIIGSALLAQAQPATPPRANDAAVAAKASQPMGSVLFIGNSFLFGSGSPLRYYRAATVTDLNGTGFGGVPALFKSFTAQAGLDFTVSQETVSGQGLDHHIAEKAGVIGRPWDRVVMLGYSLLNRNKPGDPALLIQSAKQVAELLHSKNPQVDIRLIATWARADAVYPPTGHWHGKSVEQMTRDVRAAYDQAAASLRAERALVPYEPSGKQKHYHAAFRLAAGGLLVNAPRSMGLTGEGRELAVHTHDASAVVHLHLPSGSKPFDISQVLAVWGLGEIEGQKLLIKVNGKPAKSSYVLKDRDDVVLYLAGNPTPLAFDWDQIPLDPAK